MVIVVIAPSTYGMLSAEHPNPDVRRAFSKIWRLAQRPHERWLGTRCHRMSRNAAGWETNVPIRIERTMDEPPRVWILAQKLLGQRRESLTGGMRAPGGSPGECIRKTSQDASSPSKSRRTMDENQRTSCFGDKGMQGLGSNRVLTMSNCSVDRLRIQSLGSRSPTRYSADITKASQLPSGMVSIENLLDISLISGRMHPITLLALSGMRLLEANHARI
ncbi:hypothetical protein BD311DRAFT_740427 [Dichomitus squalens]|uniref:Uncharacterized protein n=1 Tax=Dichomitus squalens TaxID=114155 RepID=A0A4Q9MIF5_9APHY|nr:hypothetical protein BD311DRAFT_740427 [Dichomitus squalens]